MVHVMLHLENTSIKSYDKLLRMVLMHLFAQPLFHLSCVGALREGFLRSIQLVLQVREGGVITAGPPCGSFIFLNMFTSGRTKWSPLGNKRGYVVEANVMFVWINMALLF